MGDLRTLHVNTREPYDVFVGEDILPECAGLLDLYGVENILAVCDGRVLSLWEETLDSFFASLPALVTVMRVDSAENDKNMESVIRASGMMASAGFSRSSCVMGVGGGAVTDLAGFISDIYMRGVKLINIPTSIISMTDSCIGGKNALDFGGKKNLLGTFRQPCAVIADSAFLRTMSPSQLGEGYGEVIKYDIISGRDISLTEDIPEMIYECLALKAGFVAEDEFDRGRRHLLNFGHTFGHAYEALSGYTISHGAAVGYGMKLVCAWAAAEGLAPASLYRGLEEKLASRGITGMPDFDDDDVAELIRYDKKNTGEYVKLVVAHRPGELETLGIPLRDIPSVMEKARSWM